ncbi:MAG TPA: response regulator [Tepidisphaeraceae bacterium]|jgi:CheY-like chemotaxis protein|nr:response regulator [Tepidisphaeraceae bacterium]
MTLTATFEKPARSEVPRVLIVEDQEVIQEVLLTIFGAAGFHTMLAGTVADAIARLKDDPHFCTLDLHLPDGRGTQILQRIRDEGLPIKVAVTTGTIDLPLLETARELHPDRIFQKPYSANDLVAWIRAEHN